MSSVGFAGVNAWLGSGLPARADFKVLEVLDSLKGPSASSAATDGWTKDCIRARETAAGGCRWRTRTCGTASICVYVDVGRIADMLRCWGRGWRCC